MNDPSELTITYTLRELLERMEQSIARIEVKLDGKADRADVEALTLDVEQVKRDVADLKLWRAKVAGVAAAVGAAVGGGASLVLRVFGG